MCVFGIFNPTNDQISKVTTQPLIYSQRKPGCDLFSSEYFVAMEYRLPGLAHHH